MQLFSIYNLINRNGIAKYMLFKMRGIIVIALLTIVFQSISQEAIVQGLQTSDKTWVKDTTYIVIQDVIFPSGVDLRIEPGTVIKINYARGLIFDGGKLLAEGLLEDSIYFIPNHSHPGQFWKWKGITIKNSNAEDQNILRYSKVEDAEISLLIDDSKNILVENSSLLNSQSVGLQIFNSSFCYIMNSEIINNYSGIELFAEYLGSTSENVIFNTKIKNKNHNVYIYREEGGIYQNNIISGNIIADGNNGIWIDNSGGSVNSENIIEKNIIINNGSDVGYGLFLAHDSTIISNNIFWNNNVAIFSEGAGHNSSILDNSFYENNWAIAIGGGSQGNKIFNNTFSLNEHEVLGIKETTNTIFDNNNLLNNQGKRNIVVNNTANNMAIPNNFWGTTNETQIDDLIYDGKDDPDRGIIEFVPFLTIVKTENPISPPYHAIKQLVDNKVLISWNQNKEGDLDRYHIYHGSYNDYHFTNKVDVGTENSYFLSDDIMIYEDIAITAVDSFPLSPESQITGHESPFAFAMIYPYAGKDTVICKIVKEIEILESNIPYTYQELYWTTSGDGVFDDESTIYPTYFPGQNDVEEGIVMISMHVSSSVDTLVDSFKLRIINDPFAYAGNDTTIIADTGVLLESAIAMNYDAIEWVTSGDGYFDSESDINPIYFPGSTDDIIGEVYLKLIVYSDCGTASDSIKLVIEPHFSVEGRLWTTQKTPYSGVVVAFIEDQNGARATLIENTHVDGNFKFQKVMRGSYYVYGLPDTNNLEDLAPGYYANKLRWQNAYLLPVDADVYDIDIFLPSIDFILPLGDASISGHMILPSGSAQLKSIYCAPWFNDSGNSYCNGGLSNNTVLLYNNDRSKLLDYTLTDEFGNFYFNEIPFGSYIVDAEKAGYLAIPSNLITLTPEHPTEAGILLEVSDFKIGFVIDKPQNQNNLILDIYPNPAQNELYINIEDGNGVFCEVSVYDIFGNEVRNYGTLLATDNLKLDIKSIPCGLYIGRVISLDKSYQFRFIIR